MKRKLIDATLAACLLLGFWGWLAGWFGGEPQTLPSTQTTWAAVAAEG